MSTETSSTTPSANSESATSQTQSLTASEHGAQPQAAPATDSHGCCHGASAASPVATIGAPHAAEAGSAAPATSHSCTKHRGSDVLQSLVKEFESADAAKRAAAVVAMGKLADCAAAAAPPLIGALRDADADVAREAATSLGVLGDASAVEPLIAIIQNADGYFHPVVRAAATLSLGQLHDVRAIEPLVQAINDPMAEASAGAIHSLGALGDQRAVPALLEVLRNEHGYFLSTVRHAAILALAKLGGDQAERELRFVSTNQWEDALIREAAIELRGTKSPVVV